MKKEIIAIIFVGIMSLALVNFGFYNAEHYKYNGVVTESIKVDDDTYLTTVCTGSNYWDCYTDSEYDVNQKVVCTFFNNGTNDTSLDDELIDIK